MNDDDERGEQRELLPLDYALTIEKPRKGHEGEQVYWSVWVATMEDIRRDHFGDEERPIDDVMQDMHGKPTQRQATILATVACWLGCNFGQCLIDRAERERDVGHWGARDCYLIAWSLDNRRHRGINSGVRAIEYMLAEPESRRPLAGFLDTGLRWLPELSADDVEVADHLMSWLPSLSGQRYLTRCRAKLEGIEREREVLRAAECARERQRRAVEDDV